MQVPLLHNQGISRGVRILRRVRVSNWPTASLLLSSNFELTSGFTDSDMMSPSVQHSKPHWFSLRHPSLCRSKSSRAEIAVKASLTRVTKYEITNNFVIPMSFQQCVCDSGTFTVSISPHVAESIWGNQLKSERIENRRAISTILNEISSHLKDKIHS
jgi:hypothetical protein